MLHRGLILCFTFASVLLSGNATGPLPSSAIGGDTVVVELHSGKRLRAQTIESDPRFPDRATLKVGNDQIQIRRSVSWNHVNRLAAPAGMLTDLPVPANVTVIDSTANPHRMELELNLNPAPAPDNSEQNTAQLSEQNRARLRSFFRFAPPQPMPDLPASELPVGGLMPVDGRMPCDGQMAGDGRMPVVWPDPCGLYPPGVPVRDPGIVIGVRNADPTAPPPPPLQTGSGAIKTSPQPRELVVAARAFNRSGLADWNSLEVSVQGRTASGLPCRVRGSLKCSLWVRRARLVRAYSDVYFEEPRDLFLLGQWSQFLDGSETDANGVQKVVLALPPRPADLNLTLGDFGLLTVDLDIPGQGRLATSSEAIPLRQAGPNRSRSVVDFGSSLLPGESASEGLNPAGNWPAPLSGLRPDLRRFNVQP
jgi:hypothetical protein